ncbi:MAG: HYR domain-containing protein, partial [FCB group bacterium]|nr:HYR domain-containing protein [FCB group bacterium]
GETPVKILAVDDAGNKDSCEFIISVHDYEPPQAICPEDMTVFNDSGLYAAIVDFEISGTDNCPGVTASAVPPTGSIFDTGTTIVQTVAIDAAGNADTSYFNIEVMLNDPDDDGRPDWDDNCPALSNPDQADIDEDGYGNVCDSCTDIDGDGYGDPGYAANICEIDNCPAVYNLDQNDTDSDGFGNVCDICPGYDDAADGDGDGVPDGCDYVYGDSNGDSQINVGDAVHMISYIFKGGSAPDPIEAGDANCDNQLNVGDAVFLISHVFKGGPAPDCGPPR